MYTCVHLLKPINICFWIACTNNFQHSFLKKKKQQAQRRSNPSAHILCTTLPPASQIRARFFSNETSTLTFSNDRQRGTIPLQQPFYASRFSENPMRADFTIHIACKHRRPFESENPMHPDLLQWRFSWRSTPLRASVLFKTTRWYIFALFFTSSNNNQFHQQDKYAGTLCETLEFQACKYLDPRLGTLLCRVSGIPSTISRWWKSLLVV